MQFNVQTECRIKACLRKPDRVHIYYPALGNDNFW